MPTAEQLGLVEASPFPTKLQSGDKIEANGLPRFEVATEGKGKGKEVAIIPTTTGEVSTFGSNIISNLRSDKAGSIGTLLRKAVDMGKSLTLFCTTEEYQGNDVLKLSQYDIRK